ncbi:TIGR03943 family putative permease subunit [Actinokineospora iranica]|uniref:TIGR03943 family protein n=1 Tax=Actinokineospora iranica TaxID=1271860 RepID=A0A1G6YN19_9PSEU|nr:TIGR03943 family protein [Actinokineospora iranica]SDD90926.1 TIGR03943 family protein [Actinokineospora iranica]
MRRETQNILLVLVGGALLKISFTGTYLLYVKPAHQYWLIAGGLIMVLLAVVSIGRDLLAARHADAGAGSTASATDGVHAAHATPVDTVTAHIASPDAPAGAQAGPQGGGGEHSSAPQGAHGPAGGQTSASDAHESDHGDHNHSARSAWLLLLPVLAIFLIAPPALGSDSVMRGDNRAAASRSSGTDGSALFPAIPQSDIVSIAMSDFAARAAWDSGGSLNGRTVRLTGFIVVQGDDTFLARLSIACCAADAFPVKVKLDGPAASGLANDTWVEVTGQVQPGSATKETDYVPTLSVEGVTEITQPENPYEQ